MDFPSLDRAHDHAKHCDRNEPHVLLVITDVAGKRRHDGVQPRRSCEVDNKFFGFRAISRGLVIARSLSTGAGTRLQVQPRSSNASTSYERVTSMPSCSIARSRLNMSFFSLPEFLLLNFGKRMVIFLNKGDK